MHINRQLALVNTGLCLGLALQGCSSGQDSTVNVSSGTQFAVTGNSTAVYFDMQGLVWQLPPAGGAAVALSDVSDDLRNITLSPDGQWLAAQSFATGHWDIVLLSTTGKPRRALTASTYEDRQPAWSADGSSVLFTSDRSGNDDIWSIDLATNKLMQLTNDPANDFAAAMLPDGLAFVSDRTRKQALYLQTTAGEIQQLVEAPAGRMYTPRASPAGSAIAWVQANARNGFPGVASNELVVYMPASGTLQVVSAAAADVFSVAPAWLDNSTLLYTADGVIKRLDIGTKTTTDVPFSAPLELQQLKFTPALPLAFAAGTEPLRGIVDPVVLSDDRIIFTALGDLWQLDTADRLTQLTDDHYVERDLAVSADGSRLAYISDRSGSMQIWVEELATGASTQVTDRSNGPRYPTFSPDGKLIAYHEVGPLGTQDYIVRLLDLESGKSRKLRSSPRIWPNRIAWSADGQHVTVVELSRIGQATDGVNQLVRLDIVADVATVMALPDGLIADAGPVSSPDYSQLALIVDGSLWQQAVSADGALSGAPVRVLDALVESPAWHADGQRITALANCGLRTVSAVGNADTCRSVTRNWQPAVGTDQQLIHAGQLWDGVSDGYQYDVDVLLEGARITAIRPHAAHPDNVPVIDAGDSTVIPGLIDHHVHFQAHQGEWVGRSLLAFGVTTVVEPGGLPYESREHLESWLSGRRLGPRLVFSGPQLDGAKRTFQFASHINSEQRLRRELERGELLGYGFLKTYRRLRPDLQTSTVKLGHAQGLPVTAHAGLRNIGVGGDRAEHLRGSGRIAYSPKQSDLLNSYDDMRAIYSRPGAAVVPTLINQGGYFDFVLNESVPLDVNTLPQYTSFYTPAYRNNLAGFTRIVSRKIELVRTGLGNAGSMLNSMQTAGVNIVAGTDSPIFPYGLAMVIELQNYVDAGLTPAQALRTATSNAAAAMGAGGEVGQLRAGMLADIVIVDGDPLSSVTDLFGVTGVMLNGRYTDMETMLR